MKLKNIYQNSVSCVYYHYPGQINCCQRKLGGIKLYMRSLLSFFNGELSLKVV